MDCQLSTGQVAQSLGISEPRLNDLIRRGRISPLPPIFAGRRLWSEEHVAAARTALAKRTTENQHSEGAE